MPEKKDMPKPSPGLESNPGKKAEMVSRKHPYYPEKETCIWLKLARQGGAKARLKRFFNGKIKCINNCNECRLHCDVRDMNKRENVVKKLERSMKPLIDNNVRIKKTLEDSSHTINAIFSKWSNKHIIADAMQRKHTSVFKVNDLKNIESIVENSTYVGFAIPEEEHSHNITKFYYFKTKLHGKEIYVNIGDVKSEDTKGKQKTHRYVYSITDSLYHEKKKEQ